MLNDEVRVGMPTSKIEQVVHTIVWDRGQSKLPSRWSCGSIRFERRRSIRIRVRLNYGRWHPTRTSTLEILRHFYIELFGPRSYQAASFLGVESTGTSAMKPVSTNETECQDSKSYRNPFNGFACLEHNDTFCIDWINVLDEEQLDELFENCPQSCNLVLECMM